jgi:hypothetical protein
MLLENATPLEVIIPLLVLMREDTTPLDVIITS